MPSLSSWAIRAPWPNVANGNLPSSACACLIDPAFGSVAIVSTNGVCAGKYDSSVVTGLADLDELDPQPTSAKAASTRTGITRRIPQRNGDQKTGAAGAGRRASG